MSVVSEPSVNGNNRGKIRGGVLLPDNLLSKSPRPIGVLEITHCNDYQRQIGWSYTRLLTWLCKDPRLYQPTILPLLEAVLVKISLLSLCSECHCSLVLQKFWVPRGMTQN